MPSVNTSAAGIRIIQVRTTYIRIQLGTTVCRARARGRDNRVTARRVLILSHANREFIGLVGSGHIEVAALGIVDVLAVVRGGNLIIAGFEAKLVAPDEAISRQTLDYDNSDKP